MQQKLYLAINSRGAARVTKSRPALGYDEIEIGLQLEIPDVLFEKPRLEAAVTVPEDAVNPAEIEANVVDNIRESVESATGVPVEITIIRPDED